MNRRPPSRTTMRLAAIASVVLAAGALASGSPARAASPVTAVPFDTLGIVSATTGINLAEPALVAIRGNEDVEAVHDLLAAGYEGSFADDVIATVGEIPPDQVVLIGVIDTSCTPPTSAGLTRDKHGELTMHAPGHVVEPIECFVAVVTVAVLTVDAAAAPPGAGDAAELIDLRLTGYGHPSAPSAIELTADERRLRDILPEGSELPDLSPPDTGDRRFAFVRPGCANTAAEMIVTPQVLDARLDYDEHGLTVDCAQAEFYLAVFDIPAGVVRETARLVDA